MILEIDCGNTRVKWRIINSSNKQVLHRGALTPEQDLCASLPIAISFIEFCRLASVWSEVAILAYVSKLEAYGLKVCVAKSALVLAGVKNSYDFPEKLGVDRWLAVVAAYHKYQRACLVLDFGTALTADFVDHSGVYLGGMIVPGVELMRSTLMQKAQRLNVAVVDEALEFHLPQKNTSSGIEVGIRLMIKGFIEEQLVIASQQFSGEFETILVGGDADLLEAFKLKAQHDYDLVFSGLALACP